MMALAELENRPTLELLFTMGEEVGLVGAQNISLPITATEALNLDWSDSNTIGIGCGGTLLMQGVYNLKTIPSEKTQNANNMFVINLQ
jgi:dipeptidase D